MASTRNRNTCGDYKFEQRENVQKSAYLHRFGRAHFESFPELGYIPSKMSRSTLSSNPIDIESKLFGISSSNLVPNKQFKCEPNLKTIPVTRYFDRPSIYIPKPVVVQTDQRPQFN